MWFPPGIKVKPDLGGTPLLAALPDIPRPVIADEPEDDAPAVDETEIKPAEAPEESRVGKEPMKFYGMEIWVPEVDFKIMYSLGKVSDFARHWKLLDEQDVADVALSSLRPKMNELVSTTIWHTSFSAHIWISSFRKRHPRQRCRRCTIFSLTWAMMPVSRSRPRLVIRCC